MTDDDEFTGIFDELTPEDFVRETSARITTHLPGSPNCGPEEFAKFVEHNIGVVRASSLASGGKDINPVAVLANASTQWIFAPTEEENMGEYIARLNHEAEQLAATWVFISRQTMVSARPGSEDMPDTSDEETIKEALAEGRLQSGVIFYAQRHEGDEWEHRHGMMYVEGDGLGPAVYGDPNQQVRYFARILEGMDAG
jgi:hypothetical protein